MHQLVELRLGIFAKPGGGEGTVVPVIPEDETVEPERIARDRSVDRAPARSLGLESLTPTAAANLVLLTAADEIVLVGIERKQNPETALRIHMKDQEIAIVLGPNLNLGAVAGEEAAIVADPKPDRRVVVSGSRGTGGRPSQHQGKEQRGDHGTSQQPRLHRGKYSGH
jgi:hypothetical protein